MTLLQTPVRASDHILGDEHSGVILVEYGDYECPHCRAAHGVVQRVIPHFGERMAFVFRHFPLTEIHPNAELAAQASEYAGAGGKFWEMHDSIYRNQDALGLPLLFQLTTALGLSQEGLRSALESETYVGKIRADFMAGVRSGVNGTPTFFINGHRHEGSYEFDSLVTTIDKAMQARA